MSTSFWAGSECVMNLTWSLVLLIIFLIWGHRYDYGNCIRWWNKSLEGLHWSLTEDTVCLSVSVFSFITYSRLWNSFCSIKVDIWVSETMLSVEIHYCGSSDSPQAHDLPTKGHKLMIQKLINDSLVSSWWWMENEQAGWPLLITWISVLWTLAACCNLLRAKWCNREGAGKHPSLFCLSDGKTIHHPLW